MAWGKSLTPCPSASGPPRQKIAQFRGEAAFGSWLYRVAISVILGHRRRLAIHRERTAPEEWNREGGPSHERSSEIGMDFDTAIERLPARARHVFVLHDVEGYKHHEIARMLKITAGTSKSQLHKARARMRDLLSPGQARNEAGNHA